MKISVIFTGGTIGSSVKEGFADVDETKKYLLLERFKNDLDIEFVPSTPYSILSENLSASELNLLQKEVEALLEGDSDGIIITHGTDTLQYTATALEFAFSNSSVPIVLVSASYPLDDPKTNGFSNFEGAVELIRLRKAGGVFVSYKNKNKKSVDIHLPSRLMQYCELDSDLFSINDEPFASYDGKIILNSSQLLVSRPIGRVEYIQSPAILLIEASPANSYSYSLSGVNAVILKPYHSGTLNTSSPAFCSLCKQAKKKNIPVFVIASSENVPYKSTEVYQNLGIIPVCDCTFVSLYMQLWVAVSLGKDIPEFIKAQISNKYYKKER